MKEKLAQVITRIKLGSRNIPFTLAESLKVAAIHLSFGLVAFALSLGNIAGTYYPFGVAAVGGVPETFMPVSVLGAVIGYIVSPGNISGFRYISALLAIAAIRFLTGKIRIKGSPFFNVFITFIAVFLTGIITLNGIGKTLLIPLSDSLLAATGSYFINLCSHPVLLKRPPLNEQEHSALLISTGMLLLGLDNLKIIGFPLGLLAAALLILVAARYGGVKTAAYLSISVALCTAVTGYSKETVATVLFAGLVAGIFSETVRIVSALGFVLAAGVGVLLSEYSDESMTVLSVMLIAAFVFMLIPKRYMLRVGKTFSGAVKQVKPDGVKTAVSMKLKFASKAISDVGNTVEGVAKELSKINGPDYKNMLFGIEKDACTGCSMQIYCWETRYEDTLSAVISMTKAVKNGECSPEENAGDEFKGRCLRPSKMGSAVYKHYSKYASSLAAQTRIDEVRSVITDQFSGMSLMLKNMAEDFEKNISYDKEGGIKAAAALRSLNIIPTECLLSLDKNGRMTVEIGVKKKDETVLNKADIMRKLELALNRDFDPPLITEYKNSSYITLTEKALLTAEVGIAQICSDNNSICGDSYEWFFDGRGHLIMILSDGMGTGGRAAVDSTMAAGLMAKLIKAGFSFNSALKILNSSMLFKSTDESSATLDIACIDLYDGKTELLKAGAGPTAVIRKGQVSIAQSTSLPAGILSNVSFDKAVITLGKGDIIMLLSDGAVSEGTDWLTEEIQNFKIAGASSLAEQIAKSAKRRRSDNHEDDITVIVAIIEKAQ